MLTLQQITNLKNILMKKLFFLMLLGIFALNMNAQVNYYKASQFAYKCIEDGKWTEWTEWQESDVTFCFDKEKNVVKVYTEEKQTYVIVEDNGIHTDSSGGKQVKYTVIDQDGDKGMIRFREEKNGNQQLYVEYDDIMWVYSGIKKITR